jgi:hypothetical protein
MSSQIEELKWISTLEEMPDEDITVLIRTDNEDDPVWFGYYESDEHGWRFVDGGSVPNTVEYWADMPEGPK